MKMKIISEREGKIIAESIASYQRSWMEKINFNWRQSNVSFFSYLISPVQNVFDEVS